MLLAVEVTISSVSNLAEREHVARRAHCRQLQASALPPQAFIDKQQRSKERSEFERSHELKTFLFACAVLMVGCGGPEAEGKALAKEFCSAVESASDPMKAMKLASEWGKKSQDAAEKYKSDPDKMQKFLSGYMSGASECKK